MNLSSFGQIANTAEMVGGWIVIGLLGLLVVAGLYDTKRRRRVLEANLRPGISRGARRTILREQRVQKRAAQAKFNAEHPYMLGGGSDGGMAAVEGGWRRCGAGLSQ